MIFIIKYKISRIKVSGFLFRFFFWDFFGKLNHWPVVPVIVRQPIAVADGAAVRVEL